MTIRLLLACACACAVATTGCSLFESKEEQCLQSDRLAFKDPDSLKVVEILGNRGQRNLENDDSFWLRYSATNSYGARESANMVCTKKEGKWIRDTSIERDAERTAYTVLLTAALRTRADTLNQMTEALSACTDDRCAQEHRVKSERFIWEYDSGMVERNAKKEAEKLVYESIEKLP